MFDIKKVRLPSEDEIRAKWCDADNTMVTVFCLTFQHEKYVSDTLTGILMQETDFAYDIVVHDDCSTDDTVKIVKEFQKSYPNIIKLIVQKENRYSKGTNPINFILEYSLGKYICICEGDDYWIDKNKMQGHMDFLNHNPDYCLHVYDSYEQEENTLNESSSKLSRLSIRPGHYDEKKLSKSFCLLPLTSCFRNEFELPIPRYFNKSINGDLMLNIMLSKRGKAFVDDSRKVAVYRLHQGGVWSRIDEDARLYEYLHTRLVKAQYLSEQPSISYDVLVDIVIKIIKRIGVVKLIGFILKRVHKKSLG